LNRYKAKQSMICSPKKTGFYSMLRICVELNLKTNSLFQLGDNHKFSITLQSSLFLFWRKITLCFILGQNWVWWTLFFLRKSDSVLLPRKYFTSSHANKVDWTSLTFYEKKKKWSSLSFTLKVNNHKIKTAFDYANQNLE
jgi:hypothetical protein